MGTDIAIGKSIPVATKLFILSAKITYPQTLGSDSPRDPEDYQNQFDTRHIYSKPCRAKQNREIYSWDKEKMVSPINSTVDIILIKLLSRKLSIVLLG